MSLRSHKKETMASGSESETKPRYFRVRRTDQAFGGYWRPFDIKAHNSSNDRFH
jgi:hypothetical protein